MLKDGTKATVLPIRNANILNLPEYVDISPLSYMHHYLVQYCIYKSIPRVELNLVTFQAPRIIEGKCLM